MRIQSTMRGGWPGTATRHTATGHLLEPSVDVKVIRGWLRHADINTTNRYAKINTRAKQVAFRATEAPSASAASPIMPVWRSYEKLLSWLASLRFLCARRLYRVAAHLPPQPAPGGRGNIMPEGTESG